MRYSNILHGEFITRPNRFIALVKVGDSVESVHVKNTGRCREILHPGTKVILQESENKNRATRYDLIAAYKGSLLINLDSLAPNTVTAEFIRRSGIFGDNPVIYPEKKHGKSRFDFYVESDDRRIFIEVKGVTLEEDGICRFPDAPTERGLKHLEGLIECVEEGYEAFVILVVQMEGMRMFTPNYETHPEFGDKLEEAERKGVRILVRGCMVTERSLTLGGPIPHCYRCDHS